MKFIIFDTETCNDIDYPLVYDFGFSVIDETAKVYESYSFVVYETFCDKELMQSAYFAEKIPQYKKEILEGKRKIARLNTIKKILRQVMKKYHTNFIIAHNVRFDYRASQTTQRYLTSSKYRWFFPYQTYFVDTLKLSKIALKNDKEYIDFCNKNNFLCKNNTPRYTAEIIYRFITQDVNFIESHIGLEDTMIEKEIFKTCIDKGCSIEDGLIWKHNI